jgi:hypothetical protein
METMPPFQTGKRRVHRKRREFVPESTPTGTVAVTSVTFIDSQTLLWTFDSDFASVDSNCLQIEASNTAVSAFIAPDSIFENAANELGVIYNSADFQIGARWRIVSPVTGITFVLGDVIVPQSGDIIIP